MDFPRRIRKKVAGALIGVITPFMLGILPLLLGIAWSNRRSFTASEFKNGPSTSRDR
jgi:hypothetical protein